MKPSPADLAETVQLIWSTQLGLEPQFCAVENDYDHTSQEDDMTGVVQISGSFAGALHLGCTRHLVRTAAEKMFGGSMPEISADDLRDTLGELTNMTAGNLKSLLPGANNISLPTVVDGSRYEVTRLDSEVVAEAKLVLNEHLLVVTLYGDRS